MKREDVERMLRHAEMSERRGYLLAQSAPHQLAELCRRWLAVEDAHRTYVNTVYDTDAGEDRGEVLATLPKCLVGFVRIVPEQGEE